MSDAASLLPPKIDVAASVRFAYAAVINNARLAIALAWLPFAILAVVQIVDSMLDDDRWFVRIPVVLIDAAVWAIFLVRWHRFILLEETTAKSLFPPGWAAYVWTGVKLWLLLSFGLLVGFALFLFMEIIAPVSSTGAIAIGGMISLVFVLALVWARISLAFPAAAVGRPITLVADAWELARGNYWRLVACLIACCAPFVIFTYGIGSIADVLPSMLRSTSPFLDLAVLFAGAAVVASLLSHIYRRLSPVEPQAAERRAS
jgi:hypothetical protein